jgi:hypothetical protein
MSNERWETLRGQMNVDEAEVLAIRRLMQAEARLADAHPERDPGLGDLLDTAAREPTQRADLYLATLAQYAAGRGGHIEVRFVLPDGPVTVLSLGDARRGDCT